MFQSTPPAWGATPIMWPICSDNFRFNPRPPRGGRHANVLLQPSVIVFQSTPPAWGATLRLCKVALPHLFQSTPPAWGATLKTPFD